jgi:hypothetical protein
VSDPRHALLADCHRLGLAAAPATDAYPGSAVVSVPYGSQRLAPLANLGYALCPSGRRHTIVSPHKRARLARAASTTR